MLILTRPDVAERRQSVRDTWAHSVDPCAARFWFVLGNAPRTQLNGDVLELNVSEGYKKISSKVCVRREELTHIMIRYSEVSSINSYWQ